jgi:CBS domain-containing protein
MPVVTDHESRKLIGIITDRDLCCSVVANAVDARSTLIEAFISRNPAACREGENLDRCERLMQERQVRRIPQADLALKDKPENVARTVTEVSKPQSSATVAV